MINRRNFITLASLGLSSSLLPGMSLANAPTDNRLIILILRGGLDGMHALVPYGDPDYYHLRPKIGVKPPGQSTAKRLTGTFALHPNLSALHPLYQSGELSFISSATTRYRSRSHFDGQNLLEVGGNRPFDYSDGWLNRALATLPERQGLALGPNVPTILQGRARVATWADSPLAEVDEDFLNRVATLYREDDAMAESLMLARSAPSTEVDSKMGRGGRNKQLTLAAKAASQLLSESGGPRIGVIESGGWDTHFAQERRLAQQFDQLSEAILALQSGLGRHWQRTCVLVVSEFGRTAAENGSAGTDHGVGGLAILAGGLVNGGKVFGDWPGLGQRDLHEGRDLQPTVHYESVFKTLLHDILEIPTNRIERDVFPDSGILKPMKNLLV